MRVPLLDLTRQYARVRADIERRVGEVFASQQFILGPTVAAFEAAFAEATGCAHAVGMSSGTDAQLAILMAMGIGRGDAVITSPYTFFATAGCIHRVGAEPVFVDIRPDTMHIDPEKVRAYLAGCRRTDDGAFLTARGHRVRAIIPVHLFGSCCDVPALREAAAGVPIIEDAAQAIGAESPAGRAGALGEAAFFSFFPTKNLGAAGDAGMAVCASAEFADKLRLMRNHGMERSYFYREIGGNFRLDALQAAVLHAKLPVVEEWNAARRRHAAQYRDLFDAAGLRDHVTVPAEPWKASGLTGHHTFHQYVIRAQRRDELLRHLTTQEIGHAIYYPVPLHLQECFAALGGKPGDCPEAERAASESLALPIFPELEEREIAAVGDAIAAFYR